MPYRTVLTVFIVIITALLACVPDATAQNRVWRIGWLTPNASPTAEKPSRDLKSFHQGMQELGYVEGKTYVVEARFADRDMSRLPALARERVELPVDIIVTLGPPPVHAAKKATITIPIVMAGSTDPVE